MLAIFHRSQIVTHQMSTAAHIWRLIVTKSDGNYDSWGFPARSNVSEKIKNRLQFTQHEKRPFSTSNTCQRVRMREIVSIIVFYVARESEWNFVIPRKLNFAYRNNSTLTTQGKMYQKSYTFWVLSCLDMCWMKNVNYGTTQRINWTQLFVVCMEWIMSTMFDQSETTIEKVWAGEIFVSSLWNVIQTSHMPLFPIGTNCQIVWYLYSLELSWAIHFQWISDYATHTHFSIVMKTWNPKIESQFVPIFYQITRTFPTSHIMHDGQEWKSIVMLYLGRVHSSKVDRTTRTRKLILPKNCSVNGKTSNENEFFLLLFFSFLRMSIFIVHRNWIDDELSLMNEKSPEDDK